MKALSICLLVLFGLVSSSPRARRSPQFYPHPGYAGYYGYGHPGPFGFGGPAMRPYGPFRPPKPFGSAYCKLMSANSSEVLGEIFFDQAYSLGPVEISGEVVGLSPGRHGFHIHENGDVSEMCSAVGGHFNPTNLNHGAPEDKQRHAGDLGNIQVGANGAARFEIADSEISLVDGNPRNILGKSAVIKEMEDDLGKGGTEDSMMSGNAGAAVACCVIEKPKFFY